MLVLRARVAGPAAGVAARRPQAGTPSLNAVPRLQHANAAILELLDTVSQADDARGGVEQAGSMPAAFGKSGVGPAAPQPWPSLMEPVSQCTAALCGRLAWRRDNRLAADQKVADDALLHDRAVRPAEGAAGVGDSAVAGERASPSGADGAAVSSGTGGCAAAECGDGGPAAIAAAALAADMARVQQLVGEICSELELGSPHHGAKPPGSELSKVRHQRYDLRECCLPLLDKTAIC